MDNAINPDDPTYTTGDHDGLAQVIALGQLWGMATTVRAERTGSSPAASRRTTSLVAA